ncbi:MAG TPA: hypothetical protein VNZ27_14675 [Rhodanobacter sp.]|nr:hypothetical protein [Rhodanobacter sp.]
MSAGHLSRQFKLAFGESPYSYLMTRRIERAMAGSRVDRSGERQGSVTQVGVASVRSEAFYPDCFRDFGGSPANALRSFGARSCK